jgi:cytochrome c oxidase subunit 2
MRNFNPYEKFATNAEVGEYYYTKVGCNGCHSVDGSAMTGPTWKGLFGVERQFSNGTPSVIADENYLLKSILEPQADLVLGYENAKMNGGWEDMLSPDDMGAIIDYIKTLK